MILISWPWMLKSKNKLKVKTNRIEIRPPVFKLLIQKLDLNLMKQRQVTFS